MFAGATPRGARSLHQGTLKPAFRLKLLDPPGQCFARTVRAPTSPGDVKLRGGAGFNSLLDHQSACRGFAFGNLPREMAHAEAHQLRLQFGFHAVHRQRVLPGEQPGRARRLVARAVGDHDGTVREPLAFGNRLTRCGQRAGRFSYSPS